MATVTVIGTTSWGTTLGIILAREGHVVRLMARTDDEARLLNSERENSRFVPGFPFPDSMHSTADPDVAFASTDLTIFAVPSQTMRANVRRLAEHILPDTILVSAVKGLELSTVRRMSQVVEEELPPGWVEGLCVLSGPNLASEVVRGMPTPTVIASRNPVAAITVQQIVNSSVFRAYTNDDVVGVELCGALKNIIALGAGMCDGMKLGDNAKSGFMTRGLAEVARLGVAAGANPSTFSGLAGMGDLIATCSSPLSRNHHVGERLAEGETLHDIRQGMQNVAEGVDTTRAALDLARQLDVEMPIAQAIHDILFGGMSVSQAVRDLMGRDPRPE
jgi:glycerol-3-phosphate dehydrogenase (NAD(P)+)